MSDNPNTVGQLTTTFQAFMQGANLLNDVRAAALTLRALISTPAAAVSTGSPPAAGAIVILGAQLAIFLAQTIQAIDDDIDGLEKTLKSYEGTENEILGSVMAGAGMLSQLTAAARPQVGPGSSPNPGTPGSTQPTQPAQPQPAPQTPSGPTAPPVPAPPVPAVPPMPQAPPASPAPATPPIPPRPNAPLPPRPGGPRPVTGGRGHRGRRPRPAAPATPITPPTTPATAGAVAGAAAGQALLRDTLKGAGRSAIQMLGDTASAGAYDAVPKVPERFQAAAADIVTGAPAAERQFRQHVEVAGAPIGDESLSCGPGDDKHRH